MLERRRKKPLPKSKRQYVHVFDAAVEASKLKQALRAPFTKFIEPALATLETSRQAVLNGCTKLNSTATAAATHSAEATHVVHATGPRLDGAFQVNWYGCIGG